MNPTQETPRFRFTFAGGDSVSGPVMGSGGFASTLTRVRAAWERARQRRDTGIFEPKPRHLACFPDFSAMGNGSPYLVDLREVVHIEKVDGGL